MFPDLPPVEKGSDLRYQEECTTRENPIIIGAKRIKVSGVEYPFVAVSDHWRPALLHDSHLVWIHHYKAIKGLRPSVFKVYYATVKVPYNRLPWTVDNQSDGIDYGKLEEAIQAALRIAEVKQAAASLGKIGGLVKSEKKAEKSRENGIKGGRKRSFSALDMEEKGETK